MASPEGGSKVRCQLCQTEEAAVKVLAQNSCYSCIRQMLHKLEELNKRYMEVLHDETGNGNPNTPPRGTIKTL